METTNALVPLVNTLQINDQTAVQLAGWNDSRVATLKEVLCPGINDAQLELFAEVCRSTGLDPFKKQIYAVLRSTGSMVNGKWQQGPPSLTIQISIDGYRITAARTGRYRGQLGPLWTGDGVKWVEAWIWPGYPAACKVGVIANDFNEPLWGVATWQEYAQLNKDGKPQAVWGKMPAHMLAKCAESLALRKAFPDVLGGTYTTDEMEQAANPAIGPDAALGRNYGASPVTNRTPNSPRLSDYTTGGAIEGTTGTKEGEIIDVPYTADETSDSTPSAHSASPAAPRPNPLAGNRCSVDGCSNVLTAGQMTMSMTKFGRPVCLLHQKDVQPIAAGKGPQQATPPAPAPAPPSPETVEALNALVAAFTAECKRLGVPIGSKEGVGKVFDQVCWFGNLPRNTRSTDSWANATKQLGKWWEAEQIAMNSAGDEEEDESNDSFFHEPPRSMTRATPEPAVDDDDDLEDPFAESAAPGAARGARN